MTATSTGLPPRYRLVVRSAAEAVALVRDRFGAGARVLSVRQIEAGGLARFLQKPRLEVIVEAGAPPVADLPGREGANADDIKAEAGCSNANPAVPPSLLGDETKVEGPEAGPPRVDANSPASGPPPPGCVAVSGGSRHEVSLLRAMGFDDMLLERIRADHPELDWAVTSPAETLARLAAWLRRAYGAIPRRTVGPRRVFLGSCGAGKTTALCKMLAVDVFVRGRQPAVLKLDGDQPNATDGLAAFCEVLGAPLLRSAAEVEEFEPDSLLYVDVPGVGLEAHGEQARLAQTLDALRVDTRVLVVNAACETELIAAAYEMGRACGATHVAFTHFDEVRRPGRLWRFILFGGLRPLLLGAGPSPAGEGDEDVFSALLARMFPPGLARAAGVEGGRA